MPIYYTQEFKTKDNKTFLVGMNWYRNAHYHISNKVKKERHELVCSQIGPSPAEKIEKYKLHITLYYKNSNCDGSNISSLVEKYVLDAIQEHGVVENDNVKFHLGTTWEIGGQDKENPRAEVIIKEIQ